LIAKSAKICLCHSLQIADASQRGGKPQNEVVAEVFQQIIVSERALTTVRCRHCQYVLTMKLDKLMYIYMNERTLNRPKNLKKKLRYTQSIEIDEKKLCEMKNRLLQEELAVARLNPSNDEVLKHFLNSSVDGHVLMEQPI